MLSRFEPNVNATITFFKLIKVAVNDKTVDDTLQNHPDWPSLLSISDALTKWEIPNGAGKIDPKNIDELPTPFIALTYNRQTPMAVVTEIGGDYIVKQQNNYKVPEQISKEAFFKTWDGAYLIAEPNEVSGEKEYSRVKHTYLLKSFISVAAAILLLVLTFIQVRRNIVLGGIEGAQFATGTYIQYVLIIMGLIVSVFYYGMK
ncbi:MAG: hypothetical protein QM640_10245 [Niabella sp.]